MEKTTQEGGQFFGKKSVIQKIKTVYIDFFGYVKEWPKECIPVKPAQNYRF